MHNGRALHTHSHTHLSFHPGRQPVLSEVSMARAAQSVVVRRGCLRGGGLIQERQTTIGDVAACPPLTRPDPPSLLSFFHLYFSTQLFLRSNTRLRPQTPTPSETTELSANLTAWSNVSRSRITTNYEPSRALSLCPPTSSTLLLISAQHQTHL